MKIGARIIKTGIAVTITVYICKYFGLEPALFGAVSAVVNVQPSVYLTLRTTRDQIIVHLLGVTVGLVLGFLMGGHPVSMGLATVIIIVLYIKLKLNHNILMGIVACMFVLNATPDQFLHNALVRSAIIFIGLTVAMAINVAFWPPRYGHILAEKLREANDLAASYFCHAVHDFVRLENQALLFPEEKKQQVRQLNLETRELSEHFRRERSKADYHCFADQNNWFALAEQFMEYNHALTERANRIYELLPARADRKLGPDAPLTSTEFKYILDLLESGCSTIYRVNGKLKTLVCDKTPVEVEEISEDYWEELTSAIEQWQPKMTGSYYLHALIEVAVVANEIRYATREGKKLIMSAGSCRLDL